MIKAAFFDCDGTLIGFNSHKLSAEDTEALDTLRANGVKLFLATGRHRMAVDRLFYPMDGIISGNGALTYIAKEGPAPIQEYDAFKIAGSHAIPDDMARQMCDVIVKEHIPTMFFLEDGNFFNFYDKRVDDGFGPLAFPVMELRTEEEMLKHTIFQMTIFVTREEETLFGKLMERLDTGRWSPIFADFDLRGTTKALGIKQICETLGITREETIAFGDGGNDIPMIEYAGIGVAMDNSLPEIKASADFVTKDVEESGVAYALKHFGIV